MSNRAKLDEISDDYLIQIRGIHGGGQTEAGVFDISNKTRLGRSEKELIQDMIDGMHALIDAEKEEGEKPKETV